MLQNSHGLPLPEGTSLSLINELKRLLNLYVVAAVGNREMQNLYSGPLFSEIVSNMDLALAAQSGTNSTTGESARRSYEYSDSDLSIIGLTVSLDMYNQIHPPYGATLILELHRKEQMEPFIRVRIRLYFSFLDIPRIALAWPG